MSQPVDRRPPGGQTAQETDSELDRWHALAQQHADLVYTEPTMNTPPAHPVVLGDAHHQLQGLDVAFENAPQSLRDVEATTRFRG